MKIQISKEELGNMISESVIEILSGMSFNQRMCLGEMAELNGNEPNNTPFPRNAYYLYVRGEGGFRKFPHFHILSKSNGWDVRMLPDGTFHSIKKRGKGVNNEKDILWIEKAAKEWAKMTTADSGGRLTNEEAVVILWNQENRE